MLGKLLKRPLRRVLNIAGRAYVSGDKLEDALEIARRLALEGMSSTLGYFHGQHDLPVQVAETTSAIVDAVAGLDPQGYVSIKAPACRYEPRLLAPILLKAKERGVLAHFDSHEIHTCDATLACAAQAVDLGAKTGITLPGRWRRSVADAALACQLGLRARVVKGEWPDPEAPARDRRQGFLEVVDSLAGRAPEVAIATHDPWLARESLSRLRAAGTRCEFELLYGLPNREVLAVARAFSIPVRTYIPFGIAWRPYAMSKAADNPHMLWWVVRDFTRGLMSRKRRSASDPR